MNLLVSLFQGVPLSLQHHPNWQRDANVPFRTSPHPFRITLCTSVLAISCQRASIYVMHCCVCSRVCGHIGGPFYCGQHQPIPQAACFVSFPMYIPTVFTSDQKVICDHCYCKKDDGDKNNLPHKIC